MVDFNPPVTKFDIYLIDTNILRKIFEGDVTVLSHVRRVRQDRIGVSIIAVAEVTKGWTDIIAQSHSKEAIVQKIYDRFYSDTQKLWSNTVVPYSLAAAECFGDLDSTIGAKDRRIAATALTYGYKLVTANRRHFVKLMPEEDIVDWTLDPTLD